MGISIRAYARHRGVSDAAVRKAIAVGRVTPEADGTIDSERADREWARNSAAPREGSLRVPVLAETGVIEPGAFVEYQDGTVTRLGLVRSTQVEAGLPEVWQTLGVQSYA